MFLSHVRSCLSGVISLKITSAPHPIPERSHIPFYICFLKPYILHVATHKKSMKLIFTRDICSIAGIIKFNLPEEIPSLKHVADTAIHTFPSAAP
ncbi:hypothetical protein FKM82_013765 [Ascaphus truei]